MWRADLGLDLGTGNTVIYRPGRGIVLQEASAVVCTDQSDVPLQAGDGAKRMDGRTPRGLQVFFPVLPGGIRESGLANKMLNSFLGNALGSRVVRPKILVAARSFAAPLAQRSLLKAVVQAGASEVRWVEGLVAAALGGGLEVHEARGALLLDVGAGATDAAVVSMGGLVKAVTLPWGCEGMDELLCRFLRVGKGLVIGKATAEKLRIGLGSAFPGGGGENWEVVGKDTVTGMPRQVQVRADEVGRVLGRPLAGIAQGCRQLLSQCPPELVRDIGEGRAYLTGGGAQMPELGSYLGQELNLEVTVLEDPLRTVAKGLGKIIEGEVPEGKLSLPQKGFGSLGQNMN